MVEVSYHPIGRESGPSLRVAMDCRSWLATEAAFTALGLREKEIVTQTGAKRPHAIQRGLIVDFGSLIYLLVVIRSKMRDVKI